MPTTTSSTARPPREGPLPVTILSGFLGSGKTTLLKHLLQNCEGLRIGALVNDVAAVNIDGHLITTVDKAKTVMQLANGCMCCSLRDSLMESLLNLAQDENLDYCVVECSGVAEPFPIAESFTFDTGVDALDVHGKPLGNHPMSKFLRLDTCVTVVDSVNLSEYKCTSVKACEKWELSKEELKEDGSDRQVSEILADQLEFADVVLVNKCDLISETQKEEVCATVRTFNSDANVLCTTRSNVELCDVLNTSLHSMEKTMKSKRWLSNMEQGEGEKSKPFKKATKDTRYNLKEFGIVAAIYRRHKPFHPKRFWDATERITGMGNALLRSKGFIWLASRTDMCGMFNQAGIVCSLELGGKWLCETPKEEWPRQDEEFVKKMMSNFSEDPEIGDRRQEIVLIGQGLKKNEIVEVLDSCLLTDAEMNLGKEKWQKMEDPFEAWDLNDLEIEESDDSQEQDYVEDGKCVPVEGDGEAKKKGD